MSRALVIVDVQRDFLPGGALGVAGGDEIVDPITEYAKGFEAVFATQDWHPPETAHFEKWPVHCVMASPGAELHPAVLQLLPAVLRKGMSREDDGYSGFEAEDVAYGKSLNFHLAHADVLEVHVVGLALDYCVKATAVDAARFGYEVTVPLALTRPVDATTGAAAIMELRAAGVGMESP